MIPRLLRPRAERMIAGVCGGLGLYFGLDPVIVRLLFVVLALTTGLTLILYPILWLVMPEAQDAQALPPGARFDPQTGQPLPPEQAAVGQTMRLSNSGSPSGAAPAESRSKVLAFVLVGVGLLILVDNLSGLFGIRGIAVPLVLVGLGIYLLRGTKTQH